MIEVTQKEFAQLCGVTSPAITAAKKAGIVRMTEGRKIDILDEVNHAYVRQALTKDAKRRRRDAATYDPQEDEDEETIRKTQAEIAYKVAATEKVELHNAKQRGELVPRDMTIEYANAFGTGVRTYLLGLPARVTPSIIADVKSGNEDNVQVRLESELSDSLDRALLMGEQAVNSIAEEWQDEDDAEEVDE